jgi:adenosylmethionine-8-amino-7-oxononanoate aminotransferase
LGDYTEFRTFFHGHSYTGNPLGCAAALANLEIFEKEKVIERLAPKIKTLEKALEGFRKLPQVREVRQKGLMVGIEVGPYPLEKRIGHEVCLAARKKGLLIRPLGNVIVLMPPLSITEGEIGLLSDATFQSIREKGAP